jgi:hypothetical protein
MQTIQISRQLQKQLEALGFTPLMGPLHIEEGELYSIPVSSSKDHMPPVYHTRMVTSRPFLNYYNPYSFWWLVGLSVTYVLIGGVAIALSWNIF